MSKVILNDITKQFGDVKVLTGINNVFEDGEFVTLLGPSGCGKTTLLRMIAGFEKPTSGEIQIDDEVVSSASQFLPPEKRNIGMVFQSYAVWPHMSVFDNVAYPLKLQKKSKSEIKAAVEEYLEVVHLSQYAKRMPSQLSGGQQQRVALARALVSQPRILLLDEPLSNLDAKLREGMRYEIKEIQKKLGITVIFVTHDQVEAMTMSDRVLVLNKGVVQQEGTPFEIYKHPANQFVADFIGKVNFIDGVVEGKEIVIDKGRGRLPYDGPLQGSVEVAIRPEDMRITAPGEGVTGTIEKEYFLGSETEYFVRVADQILRINLPNNRADIPKVGDEAGIALDHFMVFPQSDENLTQILT